MTIVYIVVALGIGVGLGLYFEKLGQKLYFKRMEKGKTLGGLAQDYNLLSAQEKKVDIIFLGDSITELYNTNEFFLGKRYINRGIGGNSTAQVVNRLESNVLKLKPKKVILLIGVNDIGMRIPNATILANIEKIASRIKDEIGAEVIIESIYPITPNLISNAYIKNETIREVNNEIKEICNKNNYQYVDVWECLADKKGFLIKDYTADGLHLNVKGYMAVTDFLMSKIENL